MFLRTPILILYDIANSYAFPFALPRPYGSPGRFMLVGEAALDEGGFLFFYLLPAVPNTVYNYFVRESASYHRHKFQAVDPERAVAFGKRQRRLHVVFSVLDRQDHDMVADDAVADQKLAE